MIITSKNQDIICFGCKVIDTAVESYIIEAGLVYYDRGVSRTIKLFSESGEELGRYQLPKELTGNLLSGYCKAATFIKVV